MEETRVEFPGFRTCSHRDEFVFRRSMSRLQKRAPCPLQIKPNNNVLSSACSGSQDSVGPGSSSSSTSTNSFHSLFSSKDPIPLLSPLVVLESACIREDNTTNPIENPF